MTETTRLRELTVRYALKRDGDGHPVVIRPDDAARLSPYFGATAAAGAVGSLRDAVSVDASVPRPTS